MTGRVLHLIDTGGPGGAETVFLQLAAGLQDRGWPALPVIGRDNWLAEQLRAKGLAPVVLNSKGSMNLGYLQRLVRVARRHQVVAIITHLYGSAIYGSLAGRLVQRPVVSVLHGQSDVGGKERMAWLKSQIVGTTAMRLVAVSAPLRDDLRRRIPAPPSRWLVIPNGVDLSSFRSGVSSGLRRQLGIPEDVVLVGALGNIRSPKAYDVLLRVAARLAEASDRYRFVIAGEGSGTLMGELRELRDGLGLSGRVHFLGLRTDVPAYLAELDIFLSTSVTEGFSIACVESMASGLPVVATRCGGPEEIVVHNETGLLCPVGDVAALAAAVAELGADPEKRARMGAAGRARAETCYSLGTMLDAYEALLRPIT